MAPLIYQILLELPIIIYLEMAFKFIYVYQLSLDLRSAKIKAFEKNYFILVHVEKSILIQ